MRHSFNPSKALAATAAILVLSLPSAGHAAESTVLSQNLTAAAASPKVAAAIWTRRSDRYTLQIVFPRWNERILVREDGRIEAPNATLPGITVWLLRADGTALPTRREVPLQGSAGGPAPALPAEMAFTVSLEAGETAVAAAIRIGDEFFIDALQPLVAR